MTRENEPIAPPAPVAIIGIGCRFPGGANSLDQLEHLLHTGASGHGPIPAARWNSSAFYNAHTGHKESMPALSGYFLREDVSRFDAHFFGMPPRDAHGADPQQRLLLQTTYAALENAGVPLEQVRGSDTSVYVSIFAQDYYRMGFKDLAVLEGSHVTGTGPAMLSNKISYVFDLTGPSLTLDTGCSGSLVALHQACQNLRLGESKMAIVGGSQLSLHPDQSVNMAGLGMVNPDGHCYAFDSRGNGYARGEGVATLVLKLLDAAIADGDHVHGVIVNSGVNQDGRTAGSIMSPSGEAQAALIRSVYAAAGLDPGQTPYVEAHGTGTQVGDKEEVGAIFRVFCQEGRAAESRAHDLAVGSVKANIGHLEATAGIAGLLKSIVVLRSGLVPPQLNLITPKPALRLDERNIHIPLKLMSLAPGPRRASVNSFGYGGTNCHVIVETLESYVGNKAKTNGHRYIRNGQPNGQITNGHENNAQTYSQLNGQAGTHFNTSSNGTGTDSAAQLFLLAANSEHSLKQSAENIRTWVSANLSAVTAGNGESQSKNQSQQLLADLAYTLSARRSLLPWRHTIVASSLAQLAEGANSLKTTKVIKSPAADRTPRLAFVFTGQGAQWVGMGRELMSVPAFAQSINKSEVYLNYLGGTWSLKNEMMQSSSSSSRLQEAEIAQPATTALQIALVDLLVSLGVTPSSVVGHSSGEIGAAYAAGLLSHEACLKAAFSRGVCSAQAVRNGTITGVKGSMLATGLGEADILPYITQVSLKGKGKISVACVNSPQSTTISGDEPAIDDLKDVLDAASVFARKLRVDTAYHSHHMVPCASAYLAAMSDIDTKMIDTTDRSDETDSKPTFYSSVTGCRGQDGVRLGPEYWAQNLVSKVRFSEALQALVQEESVDTGFTFVEVGPAAALAGPAKQTLTAAGVGKKSNSQAYLSALVRNTDARVSALTLVGRLIELGHPVSRSKTSPLLEESPLPQKGDNLLTNGNRRRVQQNKYNVVSDLAPYPFDESSYWRESRISSAHRFRPFAHHDLCGLLDPASSLQEPRWTHHLQVSALPWLRDHVVDGTVIFPASGSMCMVIEAMRQLVQMRSPNGVNGNAPVPVPNFSVSNVVFSKAICLPLDDDHAEMEIQLTISPSQEAGGKWETFRIVSYLKNEGGGGVWEENCSGLISNDVDLAASSPSDDQQIQLGGSEYELRIQSHIQKLEHVQDACTAETSTDTLDSDAFYEGLADSGNHYGPEFALMRDVRVSDKIAWGKITVPGVSIQDTHLVHPTMLDAICHMGALMFKAYCNHAPVVVGGIPDMTLLPASQTQLALLSTSGTELLVAAVLDPQDSRSCINDVYVLHKDEKTGKLTPLLKSQYVLRAYGSGAHSAGNNSAGGDSQKKETGYDGHKAHQMVWKPDAGFVSNTLTKPTTAADDAVVDAQMEAFEVASSIFISRALAEIKAAKPPIAVTAPHLKKLYEWMKRYQASEIYTSRTAHLRAPEDETRAVEAAETSLETGTSQGQMAARIGRVLPAILGGNTEPLKIMMEGGLLERVYAEGRLNEAVYVQLEDYLGCLAFKHPRMKVLEIGAGTGGATLPALRAMSSSAGPGSGEDTHGEVDAFFESYDYTDVSAGFFEQAKDKFSPWSGGDLMRFKILDIEQNPELQGYTPHSYDLVVCANVLHATPDIHATITNVRRLLRPGGKLVLVELTRLTACMNLIFGTLPGWWAFEDTHLREDCPLLSPEKWDEVLRKTGFSGLDVLSQNTRTPGMGLNSMMVSTAVDPERRGSEPEWVAIAAQGRQLDGVRIIEGFSFSPAIKAVADGLRVASMQKGHQSWVSGALDRLNIRASTSTSAGDNECVVVLDAAENSLLLSKDPQVFETVRKLLVSGTNVLWVALQDHADRGSSDAKEAQIKGYRAMIQGVARVVRRENGPSCRLVTVDVHGTTDLSDRNVVDKICTRLVEVAETSLVVLPSSSSPTSTPTIVSDESYEREYALRDGQVLIPRLQTDQRFLSWADNRQPVQTDGKTSTTSNATAKLERDVSYHQPSRPLRLQVAVPGLLSSLRFVDDDNNSGNGSLKPWEIRVSSRAHGINFKDIFVALGQMKAGVTMVGELAGVVTAVGSEMQHRYTPGDRVMGFGSPSHFASDPVLSGHLAHHIPENLSFAQAASIPVVYATAHHCLFAVARFRKGRTLLVTAASGGVGQAAIQLALHAGADPARGDIIAVVGSAAKRRLVVETYGIPETHVLSSRSRGADLRDAVLRLTEKRGVDVVLNSLAGDMLTAGLECVAPLGAFVEIGKTDIYRGSHIRMGAFDRSVTFASVDLIAIGNEQPDVVYETLGALADLLAHGHVQPPSPVSEWPIAKIDEAFRMIASRKHTGKVVLISEPGATVTAVAPRPAPFRLAEDGTYVIAGGLGDLGRKLAFFLASNGAGNIALLSRRDISDEERRELEKKIEGANSRGKTRLHLVKCDITSPQDMQSCVHQLRANALLPVRGVIHGGMVLRDRPFVNMSYDDFTAVLGPKVYGTINLDAALGSPDLDFFVTLSSTTTQVGNGSQSNYVAGNSFQDAFARARTQSFAAGTAGKTGKNHYISLNLGAIAGSSWVEGAKQSNRLNSMNMSLEDLLRSLEYAISPAGAQRDGCSQSILGLCRKTLEDADDAVSLGNPLFVRLPYKRHDNSADNDATSNKKIDTEQAVRSAATVAAAELVIQEAIVAKCAVFLDRPVDEIPIAAPLATIGLDSLVSIELKNWILRAFQALVQTSEISSALSMVSLAATVASRSKLISPETRSASTSSNSENGNDDAAAAVVNGNGVSTTAINGSTSKAALPSHGFDCCKAAKELPKYPLPDLNKILDTLVANVSHFANTPDELRELQRAVSDFTAPGSLGRGLYDQLVARAADPNLDSWLADMHLQGLYLTRRHPLAPWGNFLSTHRDSPKIQGQADRAAIIAVEAFKFMLEVEAGTLSPDWLGAQPLCSDTWKWMFNTVREPRPGCDKMRRYPGVENRYCAVLRRGHVYTVPLQHSDSSNTPVSQDDLCTAFQEIIDLPQQVPDSWAGILTSDFRDPWATNRAALLDLSAGAFSSCKNDAYFQAVEQAAFVVCLDLGKPETNEERVQQAYLGDGFNRWFDKSTQFIVAANGRSAQLTEHSMVDGLTILRLTERIHDAIQAHSNALPVRSIPSGNGATKLTNGNGHIISQPNGVAHQTNGERSPRPVKITRFTLETTPEIDVHIFKLRDIYFQATAAKKYAMHTVPSLGIETALGSGLTPKSVADAAIQLANYFHFGGNGKLPGSWEPVSTQHFHRGRPELVQVVTDEVVRFCVAAAEFDNLDLGSHQSKQQLLKAQQLLRTAIEVWEHSVREAAQGRGFLRLWDTLHGMLPADMPDKDKPALFTDPVFWRAFPGKEFHARNEAEVEDAAIGVWQEGGLWMSYSIKEHAIAVSIVGGRTKGEVDDYRTCLDRAGRIVRAIVKA